MTNLLHDLTHRVPGVPAHDGAAAHNGHLGRRNPNHQNTRRVHSEPRILVDWQNAIARLFSSRKR